MFPIDTEQPLVDVAKKIILKPNLVQYPIFDLKRKTSIPSNSFFNDHLEELSYIKLFPYGINGFQQTRDTKVTCSAYGKSRIMGSDTRFQNNDYMFYLLAKIESEKISATINLCSVRLRTAGNARMNNLIIHKYFIINNS